jgi:hypothetical protein
VPTPFFHLYIADQVISQGGLKPPLQRLLTQERAAFLLGSTTPDVQTVSGQERLATHFFRLPYHDGDPFPWDALLAKNPQIANPGRMAADQAEAQAAAKAAFIAGYLCHLQADWLWVMEIFLPNFECQRWASFRRRMLLHNVLRAYLDAQMRRRLPAEMGACLATVQPNHWLPFVKDRHLLAWRDLVAAQFEPQAAWLTVQVFAARQNASPDEYYHLLESERRMDEHIFAHIPRARLPAFENMLIQANLRLISNWAEVLL